ncbi:MAG: hypothetical protein ACRELD_10770, partial [Longimicrobiales bacterium]
VELPATNQRLAAAGIPWRLRPSTASGESRLSPPADSTLAGALADARIASAYQLTPLAGAARSDTVHLRLLTGEPWLVAGSLENGARYVVVASALSSDATTLPTGAGLVPLLDRMLTSWAVDARPTRQVIAGTQVALPGRADRVELPDATSERVEGGALFRPLEVGIHRVFAGDSLLDVFAVNTPAEESALVPLSERQLRQRLADWRVHASDAGAWTSSIFRERLGYELWPWALLAAILALTAETWLAAAGVGPHRARGPEPTPAGEPALR